MLLPTYLYMETNERVLLSRGDRMFTYAELKQEIDNDPQGIGYKTGAVWKGDQVIADLINNQVYVTDVEEVDTSDLIDKVTFAAYNAMSIDEQEWIRWITQQDTTGVNADVKLQLTGRTLTSNGTAGTGENGNSFWSVATRDTVAPAILALIEVSASRAEVLWGVGTRVTASDVGRAANA